MTYAAQGWLVCVVTWLHREECSAGILDPTSRKSTHQELLSALLYVAHCPRELGIPGQAGDRELHLGRGLELGREN